MAESGCLLDSTAHRGIAASIARARRRYGSTTLGVVGVHVVLHGIPRRSHSSATAEPITTSDAVDAERVEGDEQGLVGVDERAVEVEHDHCGRLPGGCHRSTVPDRSHTHLRGVIAPAPIQLDRLVKSA